MTKNHFLCFFVLKKNNLYLNGTCAFLKTMCYLHIRTNLEMMESEAFTLDLSLKILIAIMLTIRYVIYAFTCSKKEMSFRYIILIIDIVFVTLYIVSPNIISIAPKINGLVIMASVHFYMTVVLPSILAYFCKSKSESDVNSEASSVPDTENQVEPRLPSSVENGK